MTTQEKTKDRLAHDVIMNTIAVLCLKFGTKRVYKTMKSILADSLLMENLLGVISGAGREERFTDFLKKQAIEELERWENAPEEVT